MMGNTRHFHKGIGSAIQAAGAFFLACEQKGRSSLFTYASLTLETEVKVKLDAIVEIRRNSRPR